MKKLFALVTALGLLVAACSKDDDDDNGGAVDCNTLNSTFAAKVNPLIQTSCAKSGCHNAGSSNGVGALTTYDQIFAHRAAIRAAVSSGFMPRDATFSAQQKAIITCWIDAGAPNN